MKEDEYRRQIRAKLEEEIDEKRKRMEEQGKFPYEGSFRTLDEIKKIQKAERKRGWAVSFQLIVLYIIVALFLLVLWKFGFRFLLPK